MKESFDFSKIGDQKKFEKLSEEEQKKSFNDAKKEAEQIQEGVNKMISELSNGKIYRAIDTKEAFSVPDSVIQSPKLQEAAKEGMILGLSLGFIENTVKIKETCFIPDSFIQSPELQEAAKKGMISEISRGDINSVIEIKETFFIPENIVQEAVKNRMISEISRGDIDNAIEIKETFFIPENIVQEVAKKRMISELSSRYIDNVVKIKEAFSIPDSFIQSPEAQKAAKKRMILEISRGSIDNAIEIKEAFSIPDSVIQSPELQEVAKKRMISKISSWDIDKAVKIKETFSIPENIVQEAAKEGMISEVSRGNIDRAVKIKETCSIPDSFIQSPELQEAVYSGFLNTLKKGQLLKTYELQEKFSLKLSPIENKATELFGEFLTYKIFLEMKDLEKGVIGQELKKNGVKKSGEAGIIEITKKIQELKSRFADHNPEKLDFENSEFMTNYFLAYTGYQNSSWGSTGRDSFLSTVNKVKSEKYPPLREEFNFVATYTINKKERNSSDKSLYRQDFLERFSVLLEDITKAKDNLENKKPFSALAEELESKRNDIIESLKVKVEELAENPQAQIGLNNRVQLLEKMNIRSIKDFQENFKILSSFKELESLLRQTVFSMGFVKNKAQLEKHLTDISPNFPELDDVSWVMNFIDHITNQETMAQYFTDKQAKKKFEKIINPVVLIEQMKILQSGQKVSGTMDITFSTHRDLQTEISGQTGDACWASKYNSILKSFPNFSSILMVKDRGEKYEKIVGSSMLIETKAENGDDLLIIRGLNPQENTINSLDIESYFSAVVDYVRKIAEKTGKKVAVAIDDHSSGHTTNRPILFDFISNIESDKLEMVRLLDPHESNFNGYDLQGDVYLLSDNLNNNFAVKYDEDIQQNTIPDQDSVPKDI